MKVALVTGGVKGIGEAITRALWQRGFMVVANYSKSDEDAAKLESLLNERISCAKFDVSDYQQVTASIQEIESKFGAIDVLVNNAGITADDLLIKLSKDKIERVIQVNLLGAIFCSQAVLKGMIKRRWGRIVNISSVVGEIGNPGQTAYCASKAGLIGFTKALAKEVGSRNITVNCITPGFIQSDMTQNLSETLKESMLKNIPLGRFGSGQDVAEVVAFLASDAAEYLTGATIPVNGGMH